MSRMGLGGVIGEGGAAGEGGGGELVRMMRQTNNLLPLLTSIWSSGRIFREDFTPLAFHEFST